MPAVKSVVISCAGTGSRLGLATTKALIEIGGETVIARQLAMLQEIEDVRVVIGYQAADVIDEVRKIRPDAVFCYNHDYFDTKTGASLYLGARHAGRTVIAMDGDLLVHPDDMAMLLSLEGEWVGYADISSEDAVLAQVDAEGYVTAFSRKTGNFEWTGPACIFKDRLRFDAEHVYHQIEPYLPMKGVRIRACDIDTYDDYMNAQKRVAEWRNGNESGDG